MTTEEVEERINLMMERSQRPTRIMNRILDIEE